MQVISTSECWNRDQAARRSGKRVYESRFQGAGWCDYARAALPLTPVHAGRGTTDGFRGQTAQMQVGQRAPDPGGRDREPFAL
jgi:hypothetical protein